MSKYANNKGSNLVSLAIKLLRMMVLFGLKDTVLIPNLKDWLGSIQDPSLRKFLRTEVVILFLSILSLRLGRLCSESSLRV